MLPESLRSIIAPPYTLISFEETVTQAFSLSELLHYYTEYVYAAQKASRMYKRLKPGIFYVIVGTQNNNIEVTRGAEFLYFLQTMRGIILVAPSFLTTTPE